MRKSRLQKWLISSIFTLNQRCKTGVTEIGLKKPCTIGVPRRDGGNDCPD